MVTLKEYAHSCGVSYETVRRKVRDNESYLGTHLLVQDGVRCLDPEGVRIMNAIQGITETYEVIPVEEEKPEAPGRSEREEELEAENKDLLRKLSAAHEAMLAERERFVRIIQEQNEMKLKLLEADKRVEMIEQEYKAKVMLLEMQKDPETIARQQEQIEQLKNDVGAYQDQAELHRQTAEKERQLKERALDDADELMHERDEEVRHSNELAERLAEERRKREELEQEVSSYEKSLFGFFRKKKKK